MISTLPALFFSLQLLSVDAPDPRVPRALRQAVLDLETVSRSDHDVLTTFARVAVGHFTDARMAPSPLAFHSYWTASADSRSLSARWYALVDAFNKNNNRDPAFRMMTLEAMLSLSHAMNDTAVSASVRGILPDAERELTQQSTLYGLAFGLYDADRAAVMLKQMLPQIRAIWPLANGIAALAHYEYHQDSTAFALFSEMLDRGTYTPEMFVLPLVRGLIGWETDAPNRAAALEPHLPATWSEMQVDNLLVGADELDATIRRDRTLYTIHLLRAKPGRALSLRIAPALPKGARIGNVTVNERDVPMHIEASEHDVHVVIEMSFQREAQIEIEYEMPRRRASAR